MSSLPTINPSDIPLAEAAAQRVVQTHQRLVAYLRHGMTLGQIDAFVAQTLAELGCESCFRGYKQPRLPAFPSHACLSVNDCVVHGTAASHLAPLTDGDVLKIDIGVRYRGFIGDAAWTYAFGTPSSDVRRLMEAGKESLRRGIATMRSGNLLIEFARAVQGHVEGECGFSLIRGLGGHGIGRSLHQAPYVSNVVPEHRQDWTEAHEKWRPGVLVAVEPMLAMGQHKLKPGGNQWPVRTADGSMCVHYEHDVLVTESGPRVLTAGLEDLPDVIEK
jgi:methionyl aminopeptidase